MLLKKDNVEWEVEEGTDFYKLLLQADYKVVETKKKAKKESK